MRFRYSMLFAVLGSGGFGLACTSSNNGGQDGGYDSSYPPYDGSGGGGGDSGRPDSGPPGDGGGSDAAGDSPADSPSDGGTGSGTPPWSITHDQWRTACYTLVACDLWSDALSSQNADSMSGCIFDEPQPGEAPPVPAATVTCILAANRSCSATAQCLSQGATAAGCADGGLSCAGNVATLCQPVVPPYTIDCSAFGMTCPGDVPNSNVQPDLLLEACGLGTCATAGALSCTGSGALGQCSASLHVDQVQNCAAFAGATCTVGTDGGGGCLGSGAACTSDACSGTILDACLGGFVAPYDCSQQGLTCVVDPQTSKGRCGLGTACPRANSDGCNDPSTAGWCDQGVVAAGNCTSLGFTGCSLNNLDSAGSCH